MKRLIASTLLIVALSLPALATPQVVATHAVFGEIATLVGGDQIEVTVLIPSGFCPGHYDLSPSDYAALIQADLVIYSGFEPWVEQLEGRTQPEALVQLGGTWNTPSAAAQQATAIANLLSEQIPAATGTFEANCATYISQLQAVEGALIEQASDLSISGTPVICMQWQASFVSWLGFDVAVSYGLPENLSLQDLVELANAGLAANAVLVIDNLQSGIEFGGKLAREVAAVHVVLSNFPGALPKTATLIDLFIRNAEALFTAMEPIE